MYPCRRRRTIVSLLPRGKFRHGPRRPPLLIVAAGGGQHPPSPPQLHFSSFMVSFLPYLLVFSPSHTEESDHRKEKAGIVVLYMAQLLGKRVQILRYGESRSETIPHKNKKIILQCRHPMQAASLNFLSLHTILVSPLR